MIPREFVSFLGICISVLALVTLAVAEREHFACRPGDGAVYIAGAVKLYGC